MKSYRMGLLGKKIGMTQVFTEAGMAVPVTVIQAGPCTVVQVKKKDKGRYYAIQLGFDEGEEKKFSKPLMGHFGRAKVKPFKLLAEIRLSAEDIKKFSEGQSIGADIFTAGDYVDVTGVSKGKGFAGVIKRHHFHGFPASHGTHEYFRHGGSVGQHSFPGRIFKGLKMPGHMGNARRTTQNIKVVKVIADKNLLLVQGSVPGANGGYLAVRKAVKKKMKPAPEKGGA